MFKEVQQFNKEVIGIDRQPGIIEDQKEVDWLIGSLLEEIQEYKDAQQNGDFVGCLDAICDLIYFAAGAMTRMGIDASVSSEIFKSIHGCNMHKAKGKKKERIFAHDLDATKPEGWVGPEDKICDILDNNYGHWHEES